MQSKTSFVIKNDVAMLGLVIYYRSGGVNRRVVKRLFKVDAGFSSVESKCLRFSCGRREEEEREKIFWLRTTGRKLRQVEITERSSLILQSTRNERRRAKMKGYKKGGEGEGEREGEEEEKMRERREEKEEEMAAEERVEVTRVTEQTSGTVAEGRC